MMPLYPAYWQNNVKIQNQLQELIKQKITIFVTNSKEVTIKEGRKYLTVEYLRDKEFVSQKGQNGERIPLQRVNGVVYLSTANVNPQDVLLKKIPTVVFTPSGEVYISAVKTKKVEEKNYYRLISEVCSFIGDNLQRFFQKYLTRKGAGYPSVRIDRRGKYYPVRKSWFFHPTFVNCTEGYPIWAVEQRLNYFIHTAKTDYAGEALVGFAIISASNLNIPLPLFTNQTNKGYLTMSVEAKGGNTFSGVINPFYLFGAGVYAFGFIDRIKAKTFNHTQLENIPPKGQTFVFINELMSNPNLLYFLAEDLARLKRRVMSG